MSRCDYHNFCRITYNEKRKMDKDKLLAMHNRKIKHFADNTRWAKASIELIKDFNDLIDGDTYDFNKGLKVDLKEQFESCISHWAHTRNFIQEFDFLRGNKEDIVEQDEAKKGE